MKTAFHSSFTHLISLSDSVEEVIPTSNQIHPQHNAVYSVFIQSHSPNFGVMSLMSDSERRGWESPRERIQPKLPSL